MRALAFLLAVLSVPAVGFSQWLHYPTEGVPKNADGTPDLTAPAPKMPDGKPDFSGLWRPGKRMPCKTSSGQSVECNTELGGGPLGRNLGAELPGGLPYQPWAADLRKVRSAENSVDDPHVRCLPDNPPRAWQLPHLTKAIHTQKLLVLLYEINAMYRQIFIDGRPMPDDPNPAWNGYSTAKWDGDALVVQTVGFRDALWIDTGGSPMSDAAKMTERIRRPNFGTLEIDITIDDPKTYTRPFTVKSTQTIMLDTELMDEFCLENEKSWQRMEAVRPKR